MKTQMADLYKPSGDDAKDAVHWQAIAELVLNTINFAGDTFVTEFVIWIYYEKYDPKRMPDDRIHLPSIVSSMPLHMGDRIMIDQKLNERWNMTIGQIGNFPYGGERVIPVIAVVKNADEAQELINLVSVLLGSDRQEESLQQQVSQQETSQTPPAP